VFSTPRRGTWVRATSLGVGFGAAACLAALAASGRGEEPRTAAASPPDATLVVVGGQRGLLKPCGCTAPQLGGIARLAAFVERERAKTKALAAVSLGETLSPSTGPAQNESKAELYRAALEATGFSGSVLSPGDLSPSTPALWQSYGTPAATPQPPLNVKWKEDGPLAALARCDRLLRFSAGDLPVRVVSVVDPTLRDAFVHTGLADAVLPPEPALTALPKEPGLLVVAAHVMREEMTAVMRGATGKADAVVVVDVAGEVGSAAPVAERRLEKPLLVAFGGLGKEAGVLRARRRGDAWTYAWEATRLEPSLETGASRLRDDVERLFAAYRRRVREEGLLERLPRAQDEGPGWVGSARCEPCHKAIHASWKATPHATALETLERKDYAHDPECVACHVVGWSRAAQGPWTRDASSFWTPEKTPALGGVGCEACHGPGGEHVKSPEKKGVFGARREPGRSMWRDPTRRGCETCHDAENSHGFHQPKGYEESYLPKVDHRDVPEALRKTYR
jgi:hypothetical protein